jgi:xanthine dehydrogenase accessory factor
MHGITFKKNSFINLVLIVKGKGHDLEKTEAPMIKKIGFQVSVVEDSPDFAKKDYFPDIEDVHIEDMEVFAGSVSSESKTYHCPLTRIFQRQGHTQTTFKERI